MFEYIRGRLVSEETEWAVIETGGFGYRVNGSRFTLTALPSPGTEVKLLLHPVYREDDVILYGFADEEERKLFRTLIAISGIGPKAAMGVLSQFPGNELIRHILNGDAKAIARAPGIGKKSAERIVLELKDHYKGVTPEDQYEIKAGAAENMRLTDRLFNEAVNGLMGLGFPYAEAASRVEKVIRPEMSIEAVLQGALSVSVND